MTRLLDEIETANSISVLLGAVSQACGKMGTYVKTMYKIKILRQKFFPLIIFRASTTFIYDKTFKSHNRSMDEKTLKVAQKEDIEWFCSLSEAEKIPVIIGLMRISSGAAILKMQERLKPLLKKKLLLEAANKVDSGVSDGDTVEPKIVSKLDQMLKPLFKGDYEEIQYDPKDPLTIEV